MTPGNSEIGCVIVTISFRYANTKMKCDSTQNDANIFSKLFCVICVNFRIQKNYSEKRICVDEHP